MKNKIILLILSFLISSNLLSMEKTFSFFVITLTEEQLKIFKTNKELLNGYRFTKMGDNK